MTRTRSQSLAARIDAAAYRFILQAGPLVGSDASWCGILRSLEAVRGAASVAMHEEDICAAWLREQPE